MRFVSVRRAGAVAAVLSLSACVAPPIGPTIPVVPGQNKSPQEFGYDQSVCRQYAESQTAPGAAAATNQAVGSALIGTALGAGLGAAIGGGHGAAIGAASGAAAGTLYGASGSAYAQMSLQQQYNALFAECMSARGNEVPGFRPPPGAPSYGAPSYGAPTYGPPSYETPPYGPPPPPPPR